MEEVKWICCKECPKCYNKDLKGCSNCNGNGYIEVPNINDKLLGIVKEVYNSTYGAYGSIQLGEELYNKIENVLKSIDPEYLTN